MSAVGNWYANAFAQAFAGNINWSSDSIKMALLGSGYTPNLTSHVHWSDVNAQEISGTGYTAGGQALASKTLTVTAANSWGTAWSATSPFSTGQIVRPATGNGFLYYAEVGGTSSGTAPTWPTVLGAGVSDGSVSWVNFGDTITALNSAGPNWTTATISANYAVIYDSQSGTASTEPLIGLIQFGGTVSSTASTYTVTPNALGWLVITPT